MEPSGRHHSFVVPVFLLLAGFILTLMAAAWIAAGTAPFMDDAVPTAEPAASRPWLPLMAAGLAVASLWWGFRTLRGPGPREP